MVMLCLIVQVELTGANVRIHSPICTCMLLWASAVAVYLRFFLRGCIDFETRIPVASDESCLCMRRRGLMALRDVAAGLRSLADTAPAAVVGAVQVEPS